MSYFLKICCIFIYFCFLNVVPIENIAEDQFPVKIDERNIFRMERRRIMKRSVSNGIQLTKTFVENNRQYNCQIVLVFLDRSRLNQVFIVVDYTSGIITSQVRSNSSMNITSSSIVAQFKFTGNGTFVLSYTFVPDKLSGTEVRNVTVFDSNMTNPILSESACLSRASFNDTTKTNSALICCVFLAILILLIIFIIIWIKCCAASGTRMSEDSNDRRGHEFPIQKYSLLLEESNLTKQNKTTKSTKTFVNTLTADELGDLQYNIYDLDVTNARVIDDKLHYDFNRFNDIFFSIWLNSVSEQNPEMKDKINLISRQVISDRENVRKKYDNLINQKLKEIQRQIIDTNNANLSNLKRNQEAERSRILKLVIEEDQSEVDGGLNKLFDKQTRNLVNDLRLHQDQRIEDTKMTAEADVANEINSCQVAQIKTLIGEFKLNPEDGDEIIKKYMQWQQNLQGVIEGERNRQAAALAFLLENRKMQAIRREDQNQGIAEVLDKKVDSFITSITELEENDEISREMCLKVVSQFKNDKERIISEMEKAKDSQVKALLDKLNEDKEKTMEDLKLRQRSEIDNLLTTHLTGTNVKDMIQDLVKLEQRHCDEVTTTEAETDVANTDTMINLFEDIGTQTLTKIDSKIVELSSELMREGFSESDVRDVLEASNRKVKKVQMIQQQEKEKQQKVLKERLQKIKEQIDEASLKERKEQSNLLDAKTEVLNDVMNMQKTLSDVERNDIMAQFTKNNISMEKNLTASRLLQRKKMNELINAKKAKNSELLEEKLEVQIKKISEGGSKRRGSSNTEAAISSCVLEFVEAKLNAIGKRDSELGLDQEIKKMESELLAERANLVHRKEEEITALLNKIQLQKAAEHAELKEQQEKLVQLQMVALNSFEDGKNVQGIMNKHNQDKEKLNDAIFMNKKQQEELFRRRLKKQEPLSLLRGDSKGLTDQKDTQGGNISQIKRQNLENEMFETNVKSENDLKQFEIEFFKDLVKSGNFPRSEILNLIRTKFPLKTNQEVEAITEEIYPKSQENIQKQQPQMSLIASWKKISDSDKLNNPASEYRSKRGSSASIRSDQPQPLAKTRPSTAFQEESDVVPKSRKKRKNRIKESDDEYNETF